MMSDEHLRMMHGSNPERGLVALDEQAMKLAIEALREPVEPELVRAILAENGACCDNCAEIMVRACRAVSAYAVARLGVLMPPPPKKEQH